MFNILVVEDDAALRKMMQSVMQPGKRMPRMPQLPGGMGRLGGLGGGLPHTAGRGRRGGFGRAGARTGGFNHH